MVRFNLVGGSKILDSPESDKKYYGAEACHRPTIAARRFQKGGIRATTKHRNLPDDQFTQFGQCTHLHHYDENLDTLITCKPINCFRRMFQNSTGVDRLSCLEAMV